MKITMGTDRVRWYFRTMPNFRRYAWGTLLFTAVVILWGAYVRASGSGAGCGDHWPLCNGEVLPRAPGTATLIEFAHRATSGLNLLAVVGLLVGAWRVYPPGHEVRKGAVASFVFILLEAAVGAGLVLLKLVAQDSSSLRALVLSIHLVNTFLLLAALSWTCLAAQSRAHLPRVWPGLHRLLLLALMFVGVTGAITALGDTLFPSRTFQEGFAADADPLSHFLIRLRVIHPALALLTAFAGFALWQRNRGEGSSRKWADAFLSLTVAQIFLGMLNLALLAPIWTQLLHLALADLVWVCAVAWTATAVAGSRRSVAAPVAGL